MSNGSLTYSISIRGCWEWKKSSVGAGYGVISFFKRNYYVHRISYRLFIGEIPNGLMVCHKCDNVKCFNPEHLFLGTQKDNMSDAIKKNRMKFIPKGVYKGKLKYTDKMVSEMRKMRADGFTIREIRETYGISQAQLWKILTNKTRTTEWEKK